MAEIIKLPTTRKAFMEVVREQLATFEKQELAFKARERRERLLRIAHAHPSMGDATDDAGGYSWAATIRWRNR